MGLDQYAYLRDEAEMAPVFTWRKHAKLQEWAEALFTCRTGQSSDALNCGELRLTHDDIVALRTLVETGTLPESPGGFFYGHQFQDESASEYRDQDLAFCEWALAAIEDGETVCYSCWW